MTERGRHRRNRERTGAAGPKNDSVEAKHDVIPISAVDVGVEARRLVDAVLRSGHLAQGPKVEELEALFAEAAGTDHAVAVSSGTAALFLALEALDLEPGDEVITSPFTFVATLNAILASGATARFADIGEGFTIDPDSVAAICNERTKAILPIHLYGCPADMGRLEAVASERGLRIVEDAAQAVGAAVGTRPVGSYGVGCFSLYATKNVSTGEGGMVTTSDPDVAERIRLLRNQGMRARYDYAMTGFNFRLTDVQAAIGIPQMRRLAESTSRRRDNARRLTHALQGTPGLTVPSEPEGRFHVYHQYTVRLDGSTAEKRLRVVDRLRKAGIDTGIYYPRLVNGYECFAAHELVVMDPTPRAALAADQVLSLPVHPKLAEADLEHIAGALQNALDA